MNKLKTISEWMTERGMHIAELVDLCGLDRKVVEAIVVDRYTTSPEQRQKLANVLGLSPNDIRWGQTIEVEHMYGHGPQFGRSP